MDFDRINVLLNIIVQLQGFPKYKNILVAAVTELDGIEAGGDDKPQPPVLVPEPIVGEGDPAEDKPVIGRRV